MVAKKFSTKKYVLFLTLISIILIQLFIIYRQRVQFNTFKTSVPFLVKGETLDYLDLIGMDNRQITIADLQNGMPTLIFVPESPCTSCNKNFIYWKRLAQIFKGKVNVLGVVLDDPRDAFNFAESTKLNFTLYTPVDRERFREKLRLKLNFPQTILLKGAQVGGIRIGNITAEEFSLLIDAIKQMISVKGPMK